MRVWLIVSGEPLPIDATGDRPLRTGLIAESLLAHGHEVVFWTTSFDHIHKRYRSATDEKHVLGPLHTIQLLHAPPYYRNVSIQRIVNHRAVARKFTRFAAEYPRPDVILCSYPTIELSLAATEYGKRHGVRVVLDVRDLWPDMFVEVVPAPARPLARVALLPFELGARRACRAATAITGITDEFVDWGVDRARRERTELDRAFPLAYSMSVPADDAMERAHAFWNERGVADDGRFRVCFFGNFGRLFEIDRVVEAASEIHRRGADMQFVICGNGDNFEEFKRVAAEAENVVLPGWVGKAEIWTLMRRSSIGLAPYRNLLSFDRSIPNKAIEYLSAGLPVVTSLRGTLARLLDDERCGAHYTEGNAGELADLLVRLSGEPATITDMSRRAAAVFEERFVAERVYAAMAGYLEDVAAAPMRSR